MISEGRASCLAFWELCKGRLSHSSPGCTAFLFGRLMREDYRVITDVRAFSEWQACRTYLNKKTWQASHLPAISLGHFSEAEDSRLSDFNRPTNAIIPKTALPEEFDCRLAWELMNNNKGKHQTGYRWHGYVPLTARKTVHLGMESLSPLLNLKLLIPCPPNITSIKL